MGAKKVRPLRLRDFIDGKINSEDMRFGWRVFKKGGGYAASFDILDFDFGELADVGEEQINEFLKSDSYAAYKNRRDVILSSKARKRECTYFEAQSLVEIQDFFDQNQINARADALYRRDARKKSV